MSGGVEVVAVCAQCRNLEALPRREVAELRDADLVGLRFVTKPGKKRPNSKRRAYEAAIKTPQWRDLRDRVFERAGGMCEVDGCEEEATDLAHLHYEKPLGEETEADVQAQCSFHNQQERQQRITRSVLG